MFPVLFDEPFNLSPLNTLCQLLAIAHYLLTKYQSRYVIIIYYYMIGVACN